LRLCLPLLLALGTTVAAAQTQTVWQIGAIDDSSHEFHDSFGVDYASPSSDPVFTVGVSTPKDWLRFQPGPANGLAGGREHPFRINFQLKEKPGGTYFLKIAVLYETPRLSSLSIDLNGHRGRTTFRPKLDYAAGDWEGTFVPQTSHAVQTVSIASEWLRQGKNVLTFTAMDDPSTPQNSSGDIAPGESGLVYDGVEFLHDVHAAFPAGKLTLKAYPTIFFRGPDSYLREVVEACVNANGMAPLPTSISWKSHGFAEEKPLAFGAAEFGESCSAFDVPEWAGILHAFIQAGSFVQDADVVAQKKWTVMIVPHEHLDIGFTDYREKVAELQTQSIDGVLDLLPQYPEFRWTMDGSWVAKQYLSSRSPERAEQFFAAIRAGQIVLPSQFANQHTGVASLEGLTRSLYYTHTLAKQEKLPVGAANITDVPSYSWSYASILHDAGVQYFAAASNSWRAPVILQGRWNEKSPFYWEGPDGGRVLMWYSRAYLQLASMFGTPPTIEAVCDALPVFLQAYAKPEYHSGAVILFGSQLENTALDRGQVTLPAEWAKMYTYPRLEFSTFKAAMTHIERDFAGTIPTYRGDFGPYWEDGFTSDAHATATHRANQQRIFTAEVLATIPSLMHRELRPEQGVLADAWLNESLFDEHTWTSVAATTTPEGMQNLLQSQEKRTQTRRAQDDLTYSIERSLAQIESFLAPRDPSLLIVNSLPWQRSGWLETDLPEGKEIVDPQTRKPVLQEIVRREQGTALPGFGGATNLVHYFADAVPAVGLKLLSVVDKQTHGEYVRVETQASNVLENRFYRVTLDPETGSIRSIRDKELKRDLVDEGSPYRFASYVYVTGADDMPNNSLYRYGAGLPRPQLRTHAAGSGRIVNVRHAADGERATLESSAPNTSSIRTEILLPADAKRIDIKISLIKQATLRREAAYIAFPFRSSHPSFAYDSQNGWIDPGKNELAGGSREWYSTQHWAAVHDDQGSNAVISVDAPILAFGDIVRGAWPTEFSPKSATIFSWLMSNYWSTNFIASQGGEDTFRYSIVSDAKFEPAELTRAGWEQMTPLESDSVAAKPSPTTMVAESFLTLDNNNIAMTAWKLPEDSEGSIVRLLDLSGDAQTVTLRTPQMYLRSVERCSLLEDCTDPISSQDGSFRLSMHPFEIVTLRLHTESKAKL
jgi:alpha-mannosidase